MTWGHSMQSTIKGRCEEKRTMCGDERGHIQARGWVGVTLAALRSTTMKNPCHLYIHVPSE